VIPGATGCAALSIVALTLRWLSALLLPSGETGEGARRLAEALAGVRRTSIEAGGYKAGWMRLSAGGSKRRVKALAAGTGTGSRGRGVSSGAAGDGNAWGLDDRVADAPPSRFREGGLFSHPQAIIVYPWTAMAQTVGARSRRVIEVISKYHFEATPLLDCVTSCNFCDW